jgi:hypothetical protein
VRAGVEREAFDEGALALAGMVIAFAIGWRAGHDGGRLRGAEGVGWDLVRAVWAKVEERADAPHDAPGEGGHVPVAGWVELTKVQAAIGGAREDTVRDEGMEVDVEIQVPAEALHPGHRAALAPDALAPRPPALPGEHRPEEDAEHLAEQGGVACQQEADPPGQAQDPLPVGSSRQHPVDQVRRSLMHPSGRARRTDAAILARQRDQHLVPAVVTAHAGEAVAQEATLEIPLKDSVTGLLWQRNVDSTPRKWPDASSYCSSLSLAGLSGWRLPTAIELLSIVDLGRHNPAIDTETFPMPAVTGFWSSSPCVRAPTFEWYLEFRSGTLADNGPGASYSVRCVH